MSVTATPIFIQSVGSGFAQIALADASTLKTLYTAGANGSRLDNILMTSTETANNRDLQFVLTVSAVDYILGTVQVPINAGFTNAVPTVSAFKSNQLIGLSVDNNGNQSLNMPAGSVLKVKSLTTLASGKVISCIAQGGDF